MTWASWPNPALSSKHAYPFRLGSTSYVYPGDLVHNAERLAGQVDDIELVLFDLSDEQHNLPDAATIERLAQIGREYGLSYTVHLPFDLEPDHPPLKPLHRQPPRPQSPLGMARWTIQQCQPLNPYAYVFHLDTAQAGSPAWNEQMIAALNDLRTAVDDPERLTLENLESYPPDYLEPIYSAVPIRRALDIGHLWKQGHDPLPVMDRWLDHTRVIHLHAMHEYDHRSLQLAPAELLDAVVERLRGWSGVLTLEVFEDDFFSSREALAESWRRVMG